jgi:choline dehydrogenase-like flavoprotein
LAENGATGWSYADVLPYFRKSEGLCPCDSIAIDAQAHSTAGPLGVSVRSPILPGASEFVEAAVAAGIPRGDYNGRDRGGPSGVASLFQTTTKKGKRSSTYRAFLEGDAENRPNLTILTGAHATRVLLDEGTAKGVEYRAGGVTRAVFANKEVILSGGAVGSPHLLMLSGIGPRRELEAVGVPCIVDSPHVGKHLKDHVQAALFFHAPGVGVPITEVALSMGPDALPPAMESLKDEAQRRLVEWATTGNSLASSSLYDAGVWFSTGLGDTHSHDAQIACFLSGYTPELWSACLNVDLAQYFDDAATQLAPDQESIIILANPVLPHSEGEIALESADPAAHPAIRMNYYADPHDVKVMVAVMRRALEIVAHWPAHRKLGAMHVPPVIAKKHGYTEGEPLTDELLADMAMHFSITVYHLSCTCRIGSVVDPRLLVMGVNNLRVADASIMPNIISGNTNAASIMIGEKAAEMIAADHGVKLAEFVG